MKASLLLLLALGTVPALAKVPPDSAPGAHRILEVIFLAERSALTEGEARWMYDALIAQGIKDEEIRDNSVARGRVYCCKKNPYEDHAIWIYAPPEIKLALGDRVEVVLGHDDRSGNRVELHVVIRVRETLSNHGNDCRWMPERPYLWRRVLTCDWMQAEGWVYKKGSFKTWYKPVEATDD